MSNDVDDEFEEEDDPRIFEIDHPTEPAFTVVDVRGRIFLQMWPQMPNQLLWLGIDPGEARSLAADLITRANAIDAMTSRCGPD